MAFCSRRATFTLLTIGSILTLVAFILTLYWGFIYRNNYTDELGKEAAIPMYISVFLYNWTNSEEVIKSKWKLIPEFKECGPYVFLEHRIRVNMTWNKNDTVTYQQIRIWHFIPNISNGTLDDNITNINPIVATIAVKMKNMPYYIKKLFIGPALKYWEIDLVVTKRINELLFVGFQDPIVNILKKLNIPGLTIPFDKFGWFYEGNGSSTVDKMYTMYTGKYDLNRIGILQLWNGNNKTGSLEGACNDNIGNFRKLWSLVKDEDGIFIFSSDICSTIRFDSVSDIASLNGVTGKKFIGTDFNFDNGTKYKIQACFNGENVIPSGLRDISKCRFGAPAFVSYPHFYLADPIYTESIKGVVSNKTEDQSYFVLKPNTGILLEVKAQLQINMFVEPITSISMFENIKPTFIPMMWFRQTATTQK